MAKSETAYTLDLIRTNRDLTLEHFSAEGREAIERLVKRGLVEVVDGRVNALPVKPGKLTSTNTTKAPLVTMDTLVSVCIGSDQYAAKVVKVTAETVTVQHGSQVQTFRPGKGSAWRDTSYYLRLGESETVLDPHF